MPQSTAIPTTKFECQCNTVDSRLNVYRNYRKSLRMKYQGGQIVCKTGWGGGWGRALKIVYVEYVVLWKGRFSVELQRSLSFDTKASPCCSVIITITIAILFAVDLFISWICITLRIYLKYKLEKLSPFFLRLITSHEPPPPTPPSPWFAWFFFLANLCPPRFLLRIPSFSLIKWPFVVSWECKKRHSSP